MASRGINKVIVVGNLGQDPEVRYTPSGSAVTTLNIATSEGWRDKTSGEMQERIPAPYRWQGLRQDAVGHAPELVVARLLNRFVLF